MYTATMTHAGYVQAATMTTSDSAAGDNMAYPMRGQTDNQNNPASGDAEEGGFTPEWIETHGI